MKKNPGGRLAILMTLAALMAEGAGTAAADFITGAHSQQIEVAVALPTESDYWRRFLKSLKEQALIRHMGLRAANGDANQTKQNAQINRFIASSPKVLILVPHDALGAASVVKKARAAKIKVLALDRLALNADLDFYLAYDHEKAGELQAEYLAALAPRGRYIILGGPPNDYSHYLSLSGAMKVLGPLTAAGRLQAVVEGQVLADDAELARELVRQALKRSAERPAAVLAPDAAAAEGALAALKEAGLAGRTPLVGQNGDLETAKRLWAGEQAMTVFKDPAVLATEALNLAARLAQGEEPASLASSHVNNGFKDVPALLLEPVAIERRHLDREPPAGSAGPLWTD